MIYSRKITQGGARKDANRRDMVNDSLADLSRRIDDLDGRLDTVSKQLVEFLDADRERWVALIVTWGQAVLLIANILLTIIQEPRNAPNSF